jgi:glucose dehydrogenase
MYCAAVALLGTYGAAMAASDTEQLARIKDPNQWAAPGGNLMLQRYSALKGINADNVKDLQFAWSQSTGALRGHEGQPLVISDIGGKPMMIFISTMER